MVIADLVLFSFWKLPWQLTLETKVVEDLLAIPKLRESKLGHWLHLPGFWLFMLKKWAEVIMQFDH